ncbi:MAG: hypothetical protein V4673_14595 [Pseudomonadota bacterium]
MDKKAKTKAAPAEEVSDANLVAEIRQKVAYLCALIGKADRRGITVDFQIRKVDDKKGNFKVVQCDVRKKI